MRGVPAQGNHSKETASSNILSIGALITTHWVDVMQAPSINEKVNMTMTFKKVPMMQLVLGKHIMMPKYLPPRKTIQRPKLMPRHNSFLKMGQLLRGWILRPNGAILLKV